MILDTGIASLFRAADAALPGRKPIMTYSPIGKSWFRELSFETSPARPTEGRAVTRTDARIRILQQRDIREGDVAVLEDLDAFAARAGKAYRITRAYHGLDDDGPTPITDLTLEVFDP